VRSLVAMIVVLKEEIQKKDRIIAEQDKVIRSQGKRLDFLQEELAGFEEIVARPKGLSRNPNLLH